MPQLDHLSVFFCPPNCMV